MWNFEAEGKLQAALIATWQQKREFSAFASIPLESLGHLYEQFLKHQSTTRKTRGVYYTAPPIAQYMIRHTLGDMVANKAIESMSSVPLRVLDPACGAGSFLIAAYQFLLDWYHTQYIAMPTQYQQSLYCDYTGNWQLTLAARQEILAKHIYGVDIDTTASALTRRSLLLLLVAGLTQEAIATQTSLFTKIRSTLEHNIRSGDALIGSDFVRSYPDSSMDIQGLDWDQAFPTVMRSGGFDVIVGNPPWVFTRNAQFNNYTKQYYQTKYLADLETQQVGKMNQKGKINLFTLFLIQSIRLTHSQGQLGILVPNTLLRAPLYDAIRKYILDHCNIKQIVELNNDSFLGVTTDLLLLILGKDRNNRTIQLYDGLKQSSPVRILDKTTFFNNPAYVFSTSLDKTKIQLFEKINQHSIPLKYLAKSLIEGIVCRSDQISHYPFDAKHQKLLEGKDIRRYAITFREKYILFDRSQIHRPRPDHIWQAKEKIILRRIAGGEFSLIGALDTESYYTFASTNNLLLEEQCLYNIRYILALLNSKLLNYYYAQKFTNHARLTVNVSKTFIQQLPIYRLNLDQASERKKYHQILDLVENMCLLQKKLAFETIAIEQGKLQHFIKNMDNQIDELIYELYQLTDDEINMIKTPAASQANRCSSTSKYREETFPQSS
ncbi:MAG TPA: TaqI-like C-terminal specificity domain-containing protein [Allocoleopsis sp.]